jgi:hypothetical protein
MIEEGGRHRVQPALDRRAPLRRQRHQAEAEDQRDHQHLQQFAACKGADEVVGEDVEQELIEAGVRRRGCLGRGFRALGGRGRGGDVTEPLADADQIAEQQAECQRNGRHDLEIENRDQADLADPLDVTGGDDAGCDGEKHEGCDRSLDQAQKDVAEHFHRGGEFGPCEPDDDAENHADGHLETQTPPERLLRRRRDAGRCEALVLRRCHRAHACFLDMLVKAAL